MVAVLMNSNLNVIPLVKSLFQEVPKPVGYMLSKVPYRLRPGIGSSYALRVREIAAFERMSIESRKSFILARVKVLVRHAMGVPFYRELYESCGVTWKDIRTFEDISKLPIVTKEMLRSTPVEGRSTKARGRYLTNTGGSSGATLNFYLSPGVIPNEWAHMHTIWSKLGYDQSMLKMTFGGRSLGDKGFAYDGLRHQYSVNVYKEFSELLPELRKILKSERIRYLHGYPSALADFAVNCAQQAPDVTRILNKTLRGVFLGSEYPAPRYRDQIESVFGIPSISWYGHTERAILAWEKHENFVYHPFMTYGYCELVPNQETGGWKLIGTSYGNLASPFIRYDTGDDVEPVEVRDNLLVSFRIRSGRLGDFVIDRKGLRIPLTALIFGRHHRLFDISLFIQVRQEEMGEITVIVTPKNAISPEFRFEDWFDSSGLDMNIRFQVVDHPILSPSGKLVLKVI